MGRQYVEHEAFESMRALLEILESEDYAGKNTKTGEAFEKVNLELRVVDYEESDEDEGEWIGATFSDGAYYKEDRAGNFGVPPAGKLPNYIKSSKGEEYFDEIKKGLRQFEPEDLIKGRVRAQVDVNDNGYSTVVWNTIGPATKRKKGKASKQQNSSSSSRKRPLIRTSRSCRTRPRIWPPMKTTPC